MSEPALFPWDEIGYPATLIERDTASTLKTPFEAGYVQTRARFTRIPRSWEMEWPLMTTAEMLALLAFFRARGGAAEAFLWPYPLGVFGVPAYGGLPEAAPSPYGYDTETVVGYGEGPTFLVRFAQDELERRRVTHNWWWCKVALEEV